jgi:hypothetical protein
MREPARIELDLTRRQGQLTTHVDVYEGLHTIARGDGGAETRMSEVMAWLLVDGPEPDFKDPALFADKMGRRSPPARRRHPDAVGRRAAAGARRPRRGQRPDLRQRLARRARPAHRPARRRRRQRPAARGGPRGRPRRGPRGGGLPHHRRRAAVPGPPHAGPVPRGGGALDRRVRRHPALHADHEAERGLQRGPRRRDHGPERRRRRCAAPPAVDPRPRHRRRRAARDPPPPPPSHCHRRARLEQPEGLGPHWRHSR